MWLYLPIRWVWLAVGIVMGITFARFWIAAWAVHNGEPKPVWIPWRQIPCTQCFKDGQRYAHMTRPEQTPSALLSTGVYDEEQEADSLR